MKYVGKNGGKLLRILVNEVGVVNKELLNNYNRRNKIGDSSFEISLIEDPRGNYLFLYLYIVGVAFDVYLDAIQYIAHFLKSIIRGILGESINFVNILCRHFLIFESLDSLDREFFSKFMGESELSDIFCLHDEYIFHFRREDADLKVRLYFYFPCSSNTDDYVKVRLIIREESIGCLKVISHDKKLMSTIIMKFLKDEIYRKG